MNENSIFLERRQIRLFKRKDRTSAYWQAEFKVPWRDRPVVKSTRHQELEQARDWALKAYPVICGPVIRGEEKDRPGSDSAADQFLLRNYQPRIRNAKHRVEQELMLRILQLLDQDPAISQRRLSEELKVSIGVINTYIAQAADSGWIRKLRSQEHKAYGYLYFLTETGTRHMDELTERLIDHGLTVFRLLRRDYARLMQQATARGWRLVALIGSGDLMDIALLELQRTALELLAVERPDAPEEALRSLLGRGDAVILADPDQPNKTRRRLARMIAPERILQPQY